MIQNISYTGGEVFGDSGMQHIALIIDNCGDRPHRTELGVIKRQGGSPGCTAEPLYESRRQTVFDVLLLCQEPNPHFVLVASPEARVTVPAWDSSSVVPWIF